MDSHLNESDLLVLGSSSKIGKVLTSGIPHRFLFNYTRNPENNTNYKLLLNAKNNYPRTECGFAIVLSSITSIRECEENPKSTKKINITWVIEQIQELDKRGWSIIYLSSDAVFDGIKKFPVENDDPCPVLQYGKQKVEVENFIKQLKPNNHRILRLTKILDWGKEPWKTLAMKKNINTQPILANKKFSPLSNKSLLTQIKIALRVEEPIVHVSPNFMCNYSDFADYLNCKLWSKKLKISYDPHSDYGGLGTSILAMQNVKSSKLEHEAELFLKEII